MIRVTHNFGRLPPRLRETVKGWDGALQRAMRRIGAKVERAMNQRLSGGGEPGAYPVPRRSGHLARSGGSQVQRRSVAIFNSAVYAGAVHNGFRAYGNPDAPYYGPRPFLEDAAKTVNPMDEIMTELSAVLP